MILFSGKFANRLISPQDLRHSYGYLIANLFEQKIIEIAGFISYKEGFLNEQEISQFANTRNLEIYGKNSFLCGYFHANPKSKGTLSKRDVINLSQFTPNSLCILFDFTRVDQFNNGFLVFQTDGQNIKNSPYTISHPESEDKFYFARSLVDISEKYESLGTISPKEPDYEDILDFENSSLNSKVTPTESVYLPPTQKEDSSSDFEEFELSLIEQDFEVQKLRNDIEVASQKGSSTAYLKLQLANRLLAHLANESEILRYLESAEEEFNASQDPKSKIGLAIVKNELGLFYEDKGNFYTALNYFDDSTTLLEGLGLQERNRIVRVLNNIGNVYLKLNNFDTALNKYREAYEKSDNIADKVLVFNNIADVYLKLKNYGRAFSILQKNAEFFQENKNQYGLAIVFSKFGKLYYDQGSQYFHLAKKYSQLALAIKKREGFHRECVEDYELLSIIYLREKFYRVAEDNLVQGLNLVRSLDFGRKEAFFYDHLGKLYQAEQNFEESIEYYQLAKESYEEFGEKELEGEMLENIGIIYFHSLGNLSKGLEFLENSYEIYKEESIRRKQADVLVKIAEIHIDSQEPTSAIENLQKAHNLYKLMFDDSTAKIIAERINSLEY